MTAYTRVGLLLSLGLVTTLLVAWTSILCEVRGSEPIVKQGYSGPNYPCWYVKTYQGITWEAMNAVKSREGIYSSDEPLETIGITLPESFRSSPETDGQMLLRYCSGWPARALCYEAEWLSRKKDGVRHRVNERIRWGLRVASEGKMRHWVIASGVAPLRPLWGGIIIDTFVFAGVWLVLSVIVNSAVEVSRRFRRRTRLALVGLSILAGSISTAATAWSIAVWGSVDCGGPGHPWGLGREIDGTYTWHLALSQGRGTTLLRSRWGGDRGAGKMTPSISAEELLPRWAWYASPTRESVGGRQIRATGWPLLSMWHGLEANMVDGRAPPLRVERALPLRGTDHRALPLGICWSGFLVDSAIHSLAWMIVVGMVVFVPLAWRQRRRKALGHCVACGYDLSGAAGRCPECGRKNFQGAA